MEKEIFPNILSFNTNKKDKLHESLNEELINQADKLPQRSRLKKLFEERLKRTIIFSIIFIIFTLLFIYFLAIPLFIQFSLFLDKLPRKDNFVSEEKKVIFISPPIIKEEFNATNSAQISLAGTAEKNKTIILYLNDQIYDKVKVKNDGTFTFYDVELEPGENVFKAKATDDNNNQSSFSNIVKIFFSQLPPKLEIINPQDGSFYSGDNNPIRIIGLTDPQVKVTINNFRAIVDSEGNFSYLLNLNTGENIITITAINQAGQKTERVLKVMYQ